ncbi:MAG: hypothetical protein ACI4MC_06670 [Candidatus Coproplasma sp.]
MTANTINNNYIIFPEDFLMKGSGESCAAKMRPKTSRLLTLGYINQVQTIYNNGNAKILYNTFCDNLGISKPTVCSSIKSLINAKLIERTSQSHYKVADDVTIDLNCQADTAKKKYIIIYPFLLTEVLDFNRKTAKKLSLNAVLLLCNVIKHYSNKKRKQKYYVGGVKRVAAFLNVPRSTAQSVITELHDVGAIFFKHEVSHENAKTTLEDGYGVNGYTPTIYVVNDKLLKRCAEIQRESEKRRKAKEETSCRRADEKRAEKVAAAQTSTAKPAQDDIDYKQRQNNKPSRSNKKRMSLSEDCIRAMERAQIRDEEDEHREAERIKEEPPYKNS